MSDTPNDSSDDGSQGEQPQDGQPPGGRVPQEQATGGQRGQPQGQPAGGQVPQGGRQDGTQPQGQPPQGNYQAGPSVTDIFSRTDTLDQIKLGVVLYAIVGFGIGLGMFGLGSAFTDGGGNLTSLTGGIAILGTIGAPMAVSGVLALLVGRAISEELTDVPENLVFATAAVTTAAGTIVTYLLAIILLGIGTGSINFDNLLLPIILAAIGSAVIAAGTIWADENLLTPSGAPPQGRQQY
ncbi:MAG: hypothetical protein V5A45_05725 [Haloarculaceae archaeon]